MTNYIRFAGLWIACALIAACDSGAPSNASSTPTTTTAHAATAPAAKPDAATAPQGGASSAQMPSPPEVLSDIYQMDLHGADAVDVGNGSRASYWYGYAFELGGKHYFTGFAYETPEKFGNQNDSPGPDSKVTLTDGIYEGATSGAAKNAWIFRVSERYIGEFGSYEHAATIDTSMQAQSYPTKDNRLMLALPTWSLDSGVRLRNYAIFIFNPKKPEDHANTRWTYLGDVSTGEDNSAACDVDGSGNHLPCAKSSGTLSYVPASGSELPTIRIAMSGTVIDDADKIRTLGPADAREYRYDPAKKSYQESTHTEHP
jgi:hypothetical protein